jgi:hypothetical protein
MTSSSQNSPLTENQVMAAYLNGLAEMERTQLALHRDQIEAFKHYAKKRGVGIADESVNFIHTIGVVVTAPQLVERLLGPIPRERDDLVNFDWLRKDSRPGAQSGYIQNEHFSVMAHPHFRRGFHSSNGFAPLFVDRFWAFQGADVCKYVALDCDRVLLNTGYSVAELDTWFGAQFNDDIAKIPNGIVKLRPPSDLSSAHVSIFFADAHCLDINWTQDGFTKTFQALELKSESTRLSIDGETFYPARYVHAEFDLAFKNFYHFDGAMQYLTETEYWERRDSSFNHNVKNLKQIKSRSKKLFKLNGVVKTKEWVDLCCHFFAQNPLAYEYFSGGAYPKHINETLERIRSRQELKLLLL